MNRTIRQNAAPSFVTIARILVGVLFIFSGLIKANDPLGLSYKMQEFFEAWGWTSLNWSTYSLAIAMNTFEILLGMAMIVGYKMRLFSWLILLLTIFFGFLTGYAALSGKFQTCGCFGDCLPLTPIQSFLKDIVLLILILIIFIYRNKISSKLPIKTCIGLLSISLILGLAIQAYVLNNLPFVDCLPYKKGNHLLEQMQIPKGAITDSFAITFRYNHAGQTVEFDANHFPEDFDSTYEYVDRYDKLIRKGNATAAITDFSLKTLDGTDATNEILKGDSKYILVMFKSFDDYNKHQSGLERAVAASNNVGIPLLVATPMVTEAANLIKGTDLIYQLDAVVEKTAARANPTYFYMQGDLIVDKVSESGLEGFIEAIKSDVVK